MSIDRGHELLHFRNSSPAKFNLKLSQSVALCNFMPEAIGAFLIMPGTGNAAFCYNRGWITFDGWIDGRGICR
jgi:hypothetical protein